MVSPSVPYNSYYVINGGKKFGVPGHETSAKTDLGRVDADEDGGAVGLLPLDALDVDAELLPVALHDLAHLLALVVAAHHLHLVVLADGHRAHAVLLLQVLKTNGTEIVTICTLMRLLRPFL